MTADDEADPPRTDKAPDAFRTISEVADDLDLPQHVLRFWETRFPQIRPMKRGGGRRYYRPQDIDLLRGIRHLLYGEGYTIKGVQRILKEQGPRFVVAVAQGKAALMPQPVDADEAEMPPPEPAGSVERREPQLGRPAVPPRPPEEKGRGRSRIEPVLHEQDGRPSHEAPAVRAGHGSLTAGDISELQAALVDLIECKRALDQAR
jgi:DNA-binding transcriptional MerR regulator